MKKLTYSLFILGIILLASCQKASDKSVGSYNGNFEALGTHAGTTQLTAADDNTNWTLTCPSLSLTGTGNGVTTTMSGDNVTFNFSSASTTDGDVTAVSGTLTGNTLNYSFTVRLGGLPIAGTFSGTK